jgi:DNA-binding NarL/FixJ family response regulator
MADQKIQAASPATFRILFINTDELVLEELRKHLASLPRVTVQQVAPETDIISFVEKFSQDLILTPLHLPGKNGMETAKKIKHRFPEIKIIMLGALDSPEYQQAAKAHGVDYFFTGDNISGLEIGKLIQSFGYRSDGRKSAPDEFTMGK